MYFLTCLLNSSIRKIEKTKSIKGILFPDNIIPTKKMINKIGIKYFDKDFDVLVKNKGKTKKENKENL